MNNINLTVELCAEDRARLDKIIDLLGKPGTITAPVVTEDPLRTKLEQAVASVKPTVAEPAETPQDAPSASEHPTLDPFPEVPAEAEEPSEAVVEEPKPVVTIEMLKGKVIKLAAKADLKERVRELVQAYATKVTEIPEDKWAEVYEKLNELDGETK
jgi:hypothetical protein